MSEKRIVRTVSVKIFRISRWFHKGKQWVFLTIIIQNWIEILKVLAYPQKVYVNMLKTLKTFITRARPFIHANLCKHIIFRPANLQICSTVHWGHLSHPPPPHRERGHAPHLKGPKHEIFGSRFITSSKPISVGDFRTERKICLFHVLDVFSAKTAFSACWACA